MALGSYHQGTVHVVVQLEVGLLPTFVETNDPDIPRLQLLQCTADIRYPGYRKVLRSSRGGLCHGGGNSHRAPFGDNYPVCPRAVRAAKNRAQIMRIFNPVQDKQERML